MKFILPTALFIPGFWMCISDRGFGGLLALFAAPLVLLFAFGISAALRSLLNTGPKLHVVDFAGVAAMLAAAWFIVPVIR